ncbi:MAG: hypothetical protein J0M16_11270, partial [Gammaproteobacteria bacterium]|nr:hypothetical protein [Gammaproteobacteria bacterium]
TPPSRREPTVLRLFLGALAVTAVSWIWSVAFYVLSPVPYWTVSATADDRAAAAALLEHFPASGTYILPGRDSPAEVRQGLRTDGPVATVYIERDGSPLAPPVKALLGTLQGLVIGLSLGVAMRMLNRYTTKYWNHVAICTTVGCAYSAYPRIADIVFSDFPPGYQWMMIFSDFTSFTLMVLVMAWFTRPRPARPA